MIRAKKCLGTALSILLLLNDFSWASGMEEEFLFAEVSSPAMLTRMRQDYIPAPITVITEEDIRVTPARNLKDLIETYVPGAILYLHGEGRQLGIRGLASNIADKLLVTVNGFPMIQKSWGGAVHELEQWDMSDIKKVEVIRGPGSVTYGPGAISAVVNITTKDAADHQGLSAGVQQVTRYNSRTGRVTFGAGKSDLLRFFAHVSGSKTTGIADAGILRELSTTPSVGNFNSLNGKQTGESGYNNYYGDFLEKPQYKFHAALKFLNDFTLWTRGSRQGQYIVGGTSSYSWQNKPGVGAMPYAGFYDDIMMFSLDGRHRLGESLGLQTTLNKSYQNREEKRSYASGAAWNSTRQYNRFFGEERTGAKAIFNLTSQDANFELAAGSEWEYLQVGPARGKSRSQFRTGQQAVIISGSDSEAFGSGSGQINSSGGNPAVTVGDGFALKNIAYLSEAKMQFHEIFNVVLSGRVDSNKYLKNQMSPRAALISDIPGFALVKLVAQKSIRMPQPTEFIKGKAYGRGYSPEVLRGVEMMVTPKTAESLPTITVGGYFNNVRATASTGVGDVPVLDMHLAGLDVELKKESTKSSWGLNHAFLKLTSAKTIAGREQSLTAAALTKVYGSGGSAVTANPRGMSLSRVPRHYTKLYHRWRGGKGFVWHHDARVMWGLEGSRDGFLAVEEGAYSSNNASAKTRVGSWAKGIHGNNIFGIDLRYNASASFESGRVTYSLFCQNLLTWGGSSRTAASLTSMDPRSSSIMNGIQVVREPRTFGFRVDWKL